ncbi:nucleotidyltransferase family protein [Clostridium sp.]|uniref:nucleotidyltransferase family protein n=1 Tax=Clostridium sp. TaxID=1506 RepID=UPI00338D59DB
MCKSTGLRSERVRGRMQAVILVGGLGTRLKSVVSDRPKPMAEIVNKPFVEYVLDELQSAGINKIVFAVGYKGKMIEEYFGNGEKWGVNIEYAYEEELLGTGGAIKNARKYIIEKYVLVLNGDTYYNMDYSTFINFGIRENMDMAIVLRRVQDISRYGNVLLKGSTIVRFNEKVDLKGPGIINGGIYLMKTSMLDEIPAGKLSLENDMIPRWLESKKRLGGMVNEGYFIDIGVPEDYYRFVKDIDTRNKLHIKRVMEQIDCLVEKKVTSANPLLLSWREEMRLCLKEIYGLSSTEYRAFDKTRFEPDKISVQTNCRRQLENYCREQLLFIKSQWVNMK